MARIAVIPGDGIGIEVTREVMRILQVLDAEMRLGLSLEAFDFGAERFLRTGVGLPPGQMDVFRTEFDAILLGAMGDPRVPDNAHAREILLGLRFGLDLYVNFRPCSPLAERLSPLKGKGPQEIDMTIFRENTEGIYGAIGGSFKRGTLDEVAIAEEIHTRKGVERIIRAAFKWASAHGKRHVALGDKSNAIAAHGLWLRTFREVAAEYPQIEARHYYVDALALQMVTRPESLQVIVTTNLFGDILTDLGAALSGGLGVAPSANLNPDSTPLFEPVHGSAPELTGKGLANPAAMVLSAALMLEHLGQAGAARRLSTAVQQTVAEGQCTRDVGGTLSTTEAADAILDRMLQGLRRTRT
ncbi:putative 3-isopropylmalate dehydrogenase [Myxococcus xanthus DK 1622]|uniref:3-isopropylmalate dehydrogenase n=1 Tax=Myxococcus xanthus (strain DK1622) TaxID=246197 RepID=Q1DCT3_MYXXD|nr:MULTISPECIES: isocitrate/isopropylmalate dehydrogenase family protein [Myxococcus]ABF89148.1 putative 3-isopropylmalate dehydrogenase [Myxococcus xanthus DK 1622]NOJ56434.1 isocitrate/isopropylmalate dehydrogenase family protein [Myxococcus xanthus]QPM80924.1 isocitrate/isopropylmalate dehydrogenase family protein [Myxococcus xanthus]QVW69984.1 isocitrate/isopropylmalate dehydrogenase family protein [Myxococcus xanthus DZ2]UEO03887.1 isocitrate/isopropylmalate dehydrogenase family protein [